MMNSVDGIKVMDNRTAAQRWADNVTEFSGSWAFIGIFAIVCFLWISLNVSGTKFDPYPFLFLNWILTMISTFQSPLILLSQNRQNEVEKERAKDDREKMKEVLDRLAALQLSVEKLQNKTG